jgi:hypothetical protein
MGAFGLSHATLADTFVRYASNVPVVSSSNWTDESESEGNPNCTVCSCDSTLVPYSFNPGAGQPPDDTFLTASDFPNITIPANHVVTSVKIDVMCRYSAGTSGQIRVRPVVNGSELSAIDDTFTSGSECEYRLGNAGDITQSFGGTWTQAAINSLQIKVRRLGSNQTTLRVKAFRLTVTTTPVAVCPSAGSCCTPHATPGCDNTSCCNAVCAVDSFCCESGWDEVCVSQAADICGICPPICGNGICEPGESYPSCPDCPPPPPQCPGVGSCCAPHGTPGCDNTSCCNAVCAVDSFCCDAEWDEVCVSQAADICGICPPICGNGICEPGESYPSCLDCPPPSQCPGVGSCCAPHGTPGCDNTSCCNAVCAVDSFCCDAEWDEVCVSQAADICGICPSICGNGICEPGESFPSCEDCPAPQCPGAGSCCAPHDNPGCNNTSCCETVCGVDRFCCDVQWDDFCVEIARTDCSICGDPDLNGDGVVGQADLAILLGAWNQSGPADLDGNGTVGASDLAILIGSWG